MHKATIAAAIAGLTTVTAAALAAAVPAVTPVTPVTSVTPLTSAAAGAARASVAVAIRPDAIRLRGAALQAPPTTAQCEKAYHIACYLPGQLRTAYNVAPLYARGVTGTGATIAIVDSFGSPTIRADLATFDRQFGYPAPPKFTIITPAGKLPRYNPADSDMTGWAGETTLDVEFAHALAPGASILLVETPVSETEGVTGFPQIVTAEQYVLRHHLASVISQSFSATEETFTGYAQLAPLRAAYIEAARQHVTVLTASGDAGATDFRLNGSDYYTRPVTSWPDSDPLVTAVGGTQLREKGAGYTSVAWNDTYDKALLLAFTGSSQPSPFASGGGTSEFFARPAYQDGVAAVTGARRGVPDIAMSAACDGAVSTYSSYQTVPASPPGWYLTCGTSEATPEFAAIVALADQVAGHPLGLINPTLYALLAAHAPGLVDVTAGNNTVSFSQGSPARRYTVRGYPARPGYDLVTGAGTVNAASLVYELACVRP
jgi:subtilase family serine protease